MNHDMDRTQVGFGEGSLFPQSRGSVLNEDQQIDLANRLMDVNSEEEFEYFIGDLLSGAASAIGDFVSSPTGQALGSGLKSVAKQILPVAAQALGSRYGGAAGGQIAGALGSALAGSLEVAPEEMEWEAAGSFVKLAAEAAKNASEAPPGADPHAVAKQAIVEAAKIHAPALVGSLSAGLHNGHHHHGTGHHHHHSGRWYRHGDRIVLVGV